MKKALIMTVVIFAVVCSGAAHAALMNDRGTRAFSMEGAFVAQADDSSALWYNPAGLVSKSMPKFDLTFQKLSTDVNGKNSYDMTSSSWAGNFKYVGIGFNYVNYDYPSVGTTTPETQTTEISFGFGTNFGTSRFSLGATGGNIDYDVNGTTSQSTNQFALGALLKVVDADHFTLSLGVVDRPQADDGKSIIFRPQSEEFGLNATFITGMPIISLNAQVDQVSYDFSSLNSTFASSDNGYQQIAYGTEITFPFTEYFTLSLRLGHRTNSWDKSSTPVGTYSDVDSTSYGVGISAGKHFAADIGERKTSYSNGANERKYTTGSVSLLF